MAERALRLHVQGTANDGGGQLAVESRRAGQAIRVQQSINRFGPLRQQRLCVCTSALDRVGQTVQLLPPSGHDRDTPSFLNCLLTKAVLAGKLPQQPSVSAYAMWNTSQVGLLTQRALFSLALYS